MLLFQSISLNDVKSCNGTKRKTSWDTCIVPLPKNNNILQKLVSRYRFALFCSTEFSNGPITRKVSLHTTPGGAIIISGGTMASAE